MTHSVFLKSYVGENGDEFACEPAFTHAAGVCYVMK